MRVGVSANFGPSCNGVYAATEGVPETTGAEIIERYRRHLTGGARRHEYIGVARAWFAAGRDALSRGVKPREEDVQRYVALRRQRGLRDSTIDWELRAVRTMYRVVGFDALPVRAAALRPEARQVALGSDVLRHLIRCAVQGVFSPRDRAYLAVATTYGPRVSELGGLQQKDVDLRAGRILIPTLKGGTRRWQRIPEEIGWALRTTWQPCRSAAAGTRFHAIMHRAGVPQPAGVGWHAIRRGVVVALVRAGAPERPLSAFLRWAPPKRGNGASAMLGLYSNPARIVTLDGADEARGEDDTDDAVWAVHPFVPPWRE
jgi:integrase